MRQGEYTLCNPFFRKVYAGCLVSLVLIGGIEIAQHVARASPSVGGGAVLVVKAAGCLMS
jgi:hypothetical protein